MSFTKPTAGGSGSRDNASSAEGQRSLLEFIDLSQLTALNETQGHEFKAIVASKARNITASYLLSEADEQLLLNIPFNQLVRIKSIVLQSNDAEQAPKKIKLFINKPSLGFEDVENAEEPEAAQSLELSAIDVKEGNVIPLRFVRFQAVSSLHIFLQTNHGHKDETRLDLLDIHGVPVETTKDLSGLKKQDE